MKDQKARIDPSRIALLVGLTLAVPAWTTETAETGRARSTAKKWFPGHYQNIHEITGKPIMICDGDTCSSKKDVDAARAERANKLGDYLASAFATGYILGFGKCQFVDPANTD